MALPLACTALDHDLRNSRSMAALAGGLSSSNSAVNSITLRNPGRPIDVRDTHTDQF